jgi:hypothetical protein
MPKGRASPASSGLTLLHRERRNFAGDAGALEPRFIHEPIMPN